MSLLGNTFEEKYTNFFKFFSAKHTKSELANFIKENKIPPYSNSIFQKINLNMLDNQNLNILFHIIIRSDSDSDCLEKLKYLIEEQNLDYNVFDFIHHRKLPFYTCVKGYLESTKYLIDKMNFDINFIETDGKTLFFSAIKSYNVKLMEYLDNKFPLTIFLTDYKDNSCIFNIFKKDIKNLTKKDDIEKLKNLLRFILKRGFDINHENSEGISFREKCKFHQIENLLNDVIEEIGMEIKDKNKENESENKIAKEKKEIVNEKNEKQKEKEENKNEMKKSEKNGNINKNTNMIKNETFKLPNKVKVKVPNTEIKNETNNEIKSNKINNFDFDIDVDDEFIKSESKKVFSNNQIIKEDRKNNFIKSQNYSTKKKVCAFLTRKRQNLILNEETINSFRNNEILKKYFIAKN